MLDEKVMWVIAHDCDKSVSRTFRKSYFQHYNFVINVQKTNHAFILGSIHNSLMCTTLNIYKKNASDVISTIKS